MKFTRTPAPIKLCHARPGQVVMLVVDHQVLDEEPFLVCAAPEKGKRAARTLMSHGLYDDERNLFLVSLSTGLVRTMPNLSSKVVIFRDANLHLGEESPAGAIETLRQRTAQE